MIKTFDYEKVDLFEHFYHGKYLFLLGGVSFIGGWLRGAPFDWLLVVGGTILFTVLLFWLGWIDKNIFPVISTYESGISVNYKKNTIFYKWSEISELSEAPDSDGDDEIDKKGFYLRMKNGDEYTVLKRINGYLELFEALKDKVE
ncbi:hypothetical protein [Thalassotalea insulae]|nr:hypothetical protein [Thalassotalea insulae]